MHLGDALCCQAASVFDVLSHAEVRSLSTASGDVMVSHLLTRFVPLIQNRCLLHFVPLCLDVKEGQKKHLSAELKYLQSEKKENQNQNLKKEMIM